MESEADGGGAMRAADEGEGAAAVAEGAARGDQGDPGDPVNPGGPGDANNPGVAGEAGGAAGGLVQVQWAPLAAGPRTDAAGGDGDAGQQALQCTLTVLFPTHMDAEIAHELLTVYFRVPGSIQKELNVEGRVLVVRLSGEDFDQLRTSIMLCVNKISCVVHMLQHSVRF